MRTTLRIDDDVIEAARSLARAEQKQLGEIISRLARRGLAPRPQSAHDRGFPTFSVSKGAGPITLEALRRAEDDE